MYVSNYNLGDITDTKSTDANVIIPAVYAAVQPPLNLALNTPVWSAEDPPYGSVDGGDYTFSDIPTSSAWPFLAVDLGGRVIVETILSRAAYGECQVW